MADFRDKRILDYVWNKWVEFVSQNGMTIENPLVNNLVITEPLTLYVETTGNDGGTGSSLQPYLTVQKALDFLKKFEINSDVVIQLGAGTFDAFDISGLTFGALGTLRIVGTTSVAYTGTITSSTTISSSVVTITDSGASFTPSQWKGSVVKAISPTVASIPNRVIVENTSNTFDFCGASWASNGTQYQILQYLTTIQCSSTKTLTIGPCINESIAAAPSVLSATGFRIRLESFTCTSTSNRNVLTAGATAFFDSVRIINSVSSGLPTVLGSSTIAFDACYIEAAGNSGSGVNSNFGNNQGMRHLSIFRSYLKRTSGIDGTWISTGPLNLAFTCIEGGAIGVSWSKSSHLQGGFSAWFKNCTTGLSVSGECSTTANIVNTGTSTTAVSVFDGGYIGLSSGALTATNGISVATGGVAKVSSSVTFVATNELSVDGTTSTVAAMRASSPKIFPTTPNAYGSYVYE